MIKELFQQRTVVTLINYVNYDNFNRIVFIGKLVALPIRTSELKKNFFLENYSNIRVKP